jgi:hypothetical protein
MNDATFFTHPVHDWQRRYEALRASFLERLPARIVADRFGYAPGYVRLLRHNFVHGKLDFSEPVPEDKARRRGVTAELRAKVRAWRERRLSAGEIAELLSQEGVEISVRTVERVLAEEGFEKLPRRTRLKIGLTVLGAEVPARSELVSASDLDGQRFECAGAGVFLFAPFLAQLGIERVVQAAGLPGTKALPAMSYFYRSSRSSCSARSGTRTSPTTPSIPGSACSPASMCCRSPRPCRRTPTRSTARTSGASRRRS